MFCLHFPLNQICATIGWHNVKRKLPIVPHVNMDMSDWRKVRYVRSPPYPCTLLGSPMCASQVRFLLFAIVFPSSLPWLSQVHLHGLQVCFQCAQVRFKGTPKCFLQVVVRYGFSPPQHSKYYVLVHSRRRFLRGVPSQFTEAHLP